MGIVPEVVRIMNGIIIQMNFFLYLDQDRVLFCICMQNEDMAFERVFHLIYRFCQVHNVKGFSQCCEIFLSLFFLIFSRLYYTRESFVLAIRRLRVRYYVRIAFKDVFIRPKYYIYFKLDEKNFRTKDISRFFILYRTYKVS